MALKLCEECGREISDRANACPGCGAETRRATGRRDLTILIVVVLAVAVLFYWNHQRAVREAAEREAGYQKAIDAANRFLDGRR